MDYKLPTDVECFDAYKVLEKELSDIGQDPDIIDVNSWLMACNWYKDFLTTKQNNENKNKKNNGNQDQI